jgi:hypothetical protein
LTMCDRIGDSTNSTTDSTNKLAIQLLIQLIQLASQLIKLVIQLIQPDSTRAIFGNMMFLATHTFSTPLLNSVCWH